jgi:hypothetical protein
MTEKSSLDIKFLYNFYIDIFIITLCIIVGVGFLIICFFICKKIYKIYEKYININYNYMCIEDNYCINDNTNYI